MTMTKFMDAWFAGRFDQDNRPEVRALAELMRGGTWELIGSSTITVPRTQPHQH